MQHRVLLIADEDRIDELEQFGSIPARLLQRREPGELADWHVNSNDAFAVTPAEFFLRDAGSGDGGDVETDESGDSDTEPELDELRDWITRGLQNTTIFYLAVVSRDEDDRTLGQHVDRYQQIRERLLQAAGLRIPLLNLVQVVVFCDQGSTLEDCRDFLEQPGEVGPVATCCHVMLPSLEGGAERTQVFDARHVWPLSVSGLLLSYLLHGPRHITVHRSVRTEARGDESDVGLGHEPEEQECPRIYAWRTYALRTQLDPNAVNHKIQRAVADLGRRFAEENANQHRPEWDATSVNLTPLALQPKLSVRDWINTSYEKLVEPMRDGTRWEDRRRAAGAEDNRRLSGEVLSLEVSTTDEIRDVWRDVSADPTVVETILNDRRRLRGFSLESEWRVRSQQWDDLQDHDDRLQDAIDRFQHCDLHLAAARRAFVEGGLRTLVVAVVAALLFYGGLTVGAAMFGENQWPGWLFAIAGTLGSAAAAFAFCQAEKARGHIAAVELTHQVSDLDSLADERHRLATTSVARAEQLRRRRTRGILNVRARGLLRRLLAAMSSALVPTEVRLDEGPASLVAPDVSVVGRMQRRIFRELIDCREICTVSIITDAELTTDFMADFVQTRWKAFAESADRDLVGLYPFDETKRVFDDFRAEFENRLLAEMDSTSMFTTEGFGGEDRGWDVFLRSIRQQDYLETLSCPVEAFQLAVEDRRLPPVLLLSTALGELADDLVEEMDRSEVLSFDPRDYPRLPFVGLYVQYVELVLEANDSNGAALRVVGGER